jgi:transketolase
MRSNKDIYVITADLGYKMFDYIQNRYSKRFVNCGAAEQTMVGMACGLALEGKIPVIYSITPFLLYRPFETIRNYINREKLHVIMVGGGRDKDYLHDGFSHWSEEDKKVMKLFKNIKCYYPKNKEDIPGILDKALKAKGPVYINLTR